MALKVEYSARAVRQLQDIPQADRNRLRARVYGYAADPMARGHDARALVNHASTLRLRVGDWRVIFDVEGDTMVINRIVHRREAYR